jgi:hypothetical protein
VEARDWAAASGPVGPAAGRAGSVADRRRRDRDRAREDAFWVGWEWDGCGAHVCALTLIASYACVSRSSLDFRASAVASFPTISQTNALVGIFRSCVACRG